MAKRKAITKSVRFEVFKRDSFKCQYCGKSAPEVILHVDHITPVSKGGSAEIVNLITSCADCNLGKSDRSLDDNAVLEKQKRQLDALNERREQLEMMVEWASGLQRTHESVTDRIAEEWEKVAKGWHLNETGKIELKKLVRIYRPDQIIEAIHIAAESYIKLGDSGDATSDSVHTAWRKIGGILSLKNLPDDERQLYYIRGILRNRLAYVNEWQAMNLLRKSLSLGGEIEEMKSWSREAKSWSQWRDGMVDLIESLEKSK